MKKSLSATRSVLGPFNRLPQSFLWRRARALFLSSLPKEFAPPGQNLCFLLAFRFPHRHSCPSLTPKHMTAYSRMLTRRSRLNDWEVGFRVACGHAVTILQTQTAGVGIYEQCVKSALFHFRPPDLLEKKQALTRHLASLSSSLACCTFRSFTRRIKGLQ